MNIHNYEAKIIGINKYKELANECNLFTKKWTYVRAKRFKELVKEEMKTQKNYLVKSIKEKIGVKNEI